MNTVLSIAEDTVIGSVYGSASIISCSLGVVTKGITALYPYSATLSYLVLGRCAFDSYLKSTQFEGIQKCDSYILSFLGSMVLTEKECKAAKKLAILTAEIAVAHFLLIPWMEKLDRFGNSCFDTAGNLFSSAQNRFSNIQQNVMNLF